MQAFSPFHLLILLIQLALVLVTLIACARILRRMGYSAWWLLLGLVPIANVIGLWNLSKGTWPKVSNGPEA
jgi:hypothetical protein